LRKAHLAELANWLVPPLVFRCLTYYNWPAVARFLRYRSVLRTNRELKDRHRGSRCFIVCNGPSVKNQDLRLLRGEHVFTVSSGYHHPDFHLFKPKYHCIPQITYATLPVDRAVDWLNEMHASIGDAEIIMDAQERELVETRHLFPGRVVHYVCMGRNYFPLTSNWRVRLEGIIPRVQTVPVLVLMIAIYMGFQQIYLLGTDHDWFVTKRYDYFFPRSLMKAKETNVSQDGAMNNRIWEDLPEIKKIWGQYRAVKASAAAVGVDIFNATAGGMLDEFPRVDLKDLFRSSHAQSGA